MRNKVVEYLKQYGVKGEVETNGYHYELDYRGLHIDFCAQVSYNGNGRLVGCIYNKSLSPQQAEIMKTEMSAQGLKIDDQEDWIQKVREYNYRSVHITGYLDNIIPELLALANMPIEQYMAKRIRESGVVEKMLSQVSGGRSE